MGHEVPIPVQRSYGLCSRNPNRSGMRKALALWLGNVIYERGCVVVEVQ